MKKGFLAAVTWGLFVFAIYAIIAAFLSGGDLFHDQLALVIMAIAFTSASFLGSWVVPRMSGAAKLLGVAASLGIGVSFRTESEDPAVIVTVMVIATATARMLVDLFFPKVRWSATQLWTALLAGPVAFVMMSVGRSKSDVIVTAGLLALWTMGLGLASVVPRRWLEV